MCVCQEGEHNRGKNESCGFWSEKKAWCVGQLPWARPAAPGKGCLGAACAQLCHFHRWYLLLFVVLNLSWLDAELLEKVSRLDLISDMFSVLLFGLLIFLLRETSRNHDLPSCTEIWRISSSPGGLVEIHSPKYLKRRKNTLCMFVSFCIFLMLDSSLLHQGWVWSSGKVVRPWDGALLWVNVC